MLGRVLNTPHCWKNWHVEVKNMLPWFLKWPWLLLLRNKKHGKIHLAKTSIPQVNLLAKEGSFLFMSKYLLLCAFQGMIAFQMVLFKQQTACLKFFVWSPNINHLPSCNSSKFGTTNWIKNRFITETLKPFWTIFLGSVIRFSTIRTTLSRLV